MLLVLLVTQWARLVQKAERFVLPDAYDPMDALHRMHPQMSLAEVYERATALLREVGDDLDLRFALLQTAHQDYAQRHPREPYPDAVLETATQRAQTLLTTAPTTESWEEQIAGVAVRFMPIRNREKTVRGVLCIGPKHCGDTFTPQDEEMLGVLHSALEAPFSLPQGEAQVTEEEADGDEEQADSTPPGIVLSAEHMEILTYAAQKWTNKKIAETLKRDETTVERRFTSLYRRMGVHNRKEAVALAHQMHLLPPPAMSARLALKSAATATQGSAQDAGETESQEEERSTPEEAGS